MKKILLFLSAILVAQMANAWYVVGSNVDAFGGEWSTSGAPEMTLQADGTYLLADVALNTGDQFKFIEYRNWDSNLGPGATVQPNTEYNLYSGGGNATYGGLSGVCDIILDASKKTMKVVSDAGAAETTKYYVYFDNSASNWSKVNAYAWGAADFGGWPGKQLTATTPEGYYIAEYEGVADPAGAGLIFNDGSSQTADLTWRSNAIYTKDGDTGKTYDGGVVEPETETLTYNVTVPTGTPACYIAGEMNGWSFTAMTKVDETHYTITLDNVTKAMKYKYTYGESWDNVEMQADGVTDVQDRTYSENDVVAAWKGLATSQPETLTYNVTVPAGTPACYIAGEMNGWSFTAMTKVDDTHYTVTIDNVTKAMKYKYSASTSWDNVEMQADGVTDVQDRTYSENDVVAAWKGLTTTEPETPGTLTYNVTVPEGTAACYIVGEFNDWAAFVRMTKVDAVRYTITLENVTKSMEYKYTCGERWDNVELTIDGSEVANRTWSESDVVEKWLTPVYGELETLTYNVTVPAGTPACYIAGEKNGWTFTEMTKVDDTHYTITFDNVTKSMQYKYTCGEDWEYVEMQADGVTDVENRTWSENDVVVAWAATPTVEQPETLTYNVTVPAGTETCYIVGDMTAWSFTEMTKVDDTRYTITFDNVTKSSKYKYTSGPDWAYVETWADGSFVSDRTWSENDVVEAWTSVWSSVASVEVADVKVYGANGMLCVRAAEKVTLNVYNAQGMLVKALVVEGAADINLAAGLYIVNGTKVLVY